MGGDDPPRPQCSDVASHGAGILAVPYMQEDSKERQGDHFRQADSKEEEMLIDDAVAYLARDCNISPKQARNVLELACRIFFIESNELPDLPDDSWKFWVKVYFLVGYDKGNK